MVRRLHFARTGVRVLAVFPRNAPTNGLAEEPRAAWVVQQAVHRPLARRVAPFATASDSRAVLSVAHSSGQSDPLRRRVDQATQRLREPRVLPRRANEQRPNGSRRVQYTTLGSQVANSGSATSTAIRPICSSTKGMTPR